MTSVLAEISADDAIGVLTEQLGCVRDGRALQMAVAAEHIRAALHANAKRALEFDTNPAVHTTRLLASTRKSLGLVWSSSALIDPTGKDDSAQLALDALALLGDAIDLGGGYWIGAPLRLVVSTEETPTYIFGALPGSLVKKLSGLSPSCVASTRFAPASLKLPGDKCGPYTQTVDDWLGADTPLDAWTQRFLDEHRAKLVTSGDVTADQLEIYAPDIFLARRQNGRWFEARQLTEEIGGLRLCRPLKTVSREWSRPFYIAEFGFRSGQATLTRAAPVDFNDSQRLRFGLDGLLKVPRRIALHFGVNTFELELPYSLPVPERRALGMSWPSAVHPKRLAFHISAKPVLSRALERLGIVVDARRGGHV